MRIARHILAALVVAPLLPAPARAQGPAAGASDDIQRVYSAIDETPGLSTEERLNRKYEVYIASVEAGSAYLGALEEVRESARLARRAGVALEAGYPELKKLNRKVGAFQRKLARGLDQKSVQAFGATASALEQAKKVAALVDEISALSNDPNLTPSSRRTLLALRTTAEAMAGLGGKLPLVGASLETYGEMLREMTGAVQKVAADVTSLKGGGFSLTEEKEVLAGLPVAEHSYVRTGLYAIGLPVVMDLDTTPDDAEQPAFVRTQTGWRRVDYGELSRLVAEYRVVNQDWLGAARNPTPDEIVALLDDPATRERLADRAGRQIQIEIAEEFLAETGLTGVRPLKVEATRRELLERLQALGLALPPGGAAFRTLLKGELVEPGSSEAHLRRLVLRSNPLLADYLKRVKGLDPETASLADIASYLSILRADPARAAQALAAAPGEGSGVATAGKEPASPEERLGALCECMMRDWMAYKTRPAATRNCPKGFSTNEVVESARYDRQKGACVGRVVNRRQCSPDSSLQVLAFDWSTTLIDNPPSKRKYPEGCCLTQYQGKCWNETELGR